jgi:hypothetical protein
MCARTISSARHRARSAGLTVAAPRVGSLAMANRLISGKILVVTTWWNFAKFASIS